MWILAGPNGSGKTTFYDRFLAKTVPVFVNPDRLAEELEPADPASVAWDAARLADTRRSELLARKQSFATETVFSHLSKLEFIHEAKAAGFHVIVVFLCLNDPALNVTRVRFRVGRGGHDVPADRIAPRYERSLRLAVEASRAADEMWLYDNTPLGRIPRQIARYDGRRLVWTAARLPDWFRRAFREDLK